MVFGLVSLFVFPSVAIEDPDYTETISAGSRLYFNIDLDAGDILTIEFEVIAGGNKDIDLYIKNSNGVTIEDYGRLISGTIYFNAPYDDEFSIYFSNTFSTFTSKTVEISFDITYAKSISIYNPRSTDVFDNGYNQISWTTTGDISYVRIELYIGNTFLEVIETWEYNDGSYSWYLSSSDTYDGSNYRIRLSDYYDDSIYVFSDYFTIEIDPRDYDTADTPNYFWNILVFIVIPIVAIILVITIPIIFIRRRKKKIPKEIIPITREIPVKEEPKKEVKEREISGRIFCSSCGEEILDKTGDFCSKCGAPIK